MTTARIHLIAAESTPFYHLISRCVRRGFLCGQDKFSGQDYEHRRQWVVDRLALLSDVFAIDVLAYAVMSNHYHLVIQTTGEQSAQWEDDEVMSRWQRLFRLPLLLARYQAGLTGDAEGAAIGQMITVLRERLASVSWFMKCLNEHISRRANLEDGCKGAFWESRFKSHALLDEKALISCMVYVDLNPVRAGIAKSLETSDFTSVQARIHAASPVNLALFSDKQPTHAHSVIPFSNLADYLTLVDWTGRIVADGKRGRISSRLPSVLSRLGFDEGRWQSALKLHSQPGVVIGQAAKVIELANSAGRNWFKGLGRMVAAFG